MLYLNYGENLQKGDLKMCPVYKNKQGMGLIPMIMAVVVGAVVITSTTSWLLSLNAKISNIDGRLEAMTIATSEWNRLNAMPMDAIEAQKDKLANYTVGEYQLSVILGDKGVMDDGTCKTSGLGTDEELNCYNDSKVIIKKDGETLYSSKLLPLSADGSGGGGGGFPDMQHPFSIPTSFVTVGGRRYSTFPASSTKYYSGDNIVNHGGNQAGCGTTYLGYCSGYQAIKFKQNTWCRRTFSSWYRAGTEDGRSGYDVNGTYYDWVPLTKGVSYGVADIVGTIVSHTGGLSMGSSVVCYPAKK